MTGFNLPIRSSRFRAEFPLLAAGDARARRATPSLLQRLNEEPVLAVLGAGVIISGIAALVIALV